MPAKTVKDLVEFNNSVPAKHKVLLSFSYAGGAYRKSLKVYFTDAHGEYISQDSYNRAEYYGKEKRWQWERETGAESQSTVGITRYKEPEGRPVYPWGSVSAKGPSKTQTFVCYHAWVIGLSEAAPGYGPMLYDCLLAKLGEAGFGLMADRDLVSSMAAKLWAHYLTSRPDVTSKPMDLTGATPDEEDDCYAQHSNNPGWNTWLQKPNPEDAEYEKKQERHQTAKKAMEHVYFDNGITTLNELRAAKLLLNDGTFPLKEGHLQSLYRSFLLDLRCRV